MPAGYGSFISLGPLDLSQKDTAGLFGIDIKSNFFFDQAKTQTMIAAVTEAQMEVAVEKVKFDVMENISDPYPPSSDPGQYPKARTRNLRNNINTQVEREALQVVGYVGTDVEYGRALELGTSKMEPRPFLSKTVEEIDRNLLLDAPSVLS